MYTMPVYHALLEPGCFEQVLVCNAAHVKNVPGRKTDAVDASWLAEMLECGLLRGSFIPPEDIKAVRDVIRYRRKIVQSRSSETQRLGGVRCARATTSQPGSASTASPASAASTCSPCWSSAPGQRSASAAGSGARYHRLVRRFGG